MLILLSNNETINTNDLLYVDSGTEGKVYKYKDKAIKVYHDNLYKRILSYDDINRLKDINTRRIILPNNIIYKLDGDCGYYGGYESRYIKQDGNIYDYSKLDKDILLEEINILESDIKNISDANILLCDLNNTKNIIYNNGKVYFIDAGSYVFNKLGKYNTSNNNINEVGLSIKYHLFLLQNSCINIGKELVNNNLINIEDYSMEVFILISNIYNLDFNNIDDYNYLKHIKNILNKYNNIINYKKYLLDYYINKDSELLSDKGRCFLKERIKL